MTIALFILYMGLVLVSVVIDKHYRAVLNNNINKNVKIVSSIIGGIFIILSLVILFFIMNISTAITLWLGVLTFFIILIALIYTYRAKTLPLVSIALFLISLLLTFS